MAQDRHFARTRRAQARAMNKKLPTRSDWSGRCSICGGVAEGTPEEIVAAHRACKRKTPKPWFKRLLGLD